MQQVNKRLIINQFNTVKMLQNQKVSLVEKVGYGLGDCSANLVFQMMMIYQTKFYTDVFGLEGAIAGTVMLVARIVDGSMEFVAASAGNSSISFTFDPSYQMGTYVLMTRVD